MKRAICIRCGARKGHPFDSCTRCAFDPKGDDVAMAKSLILSNHYYRASEDRYLSDGELDSAAAEIHERGTYVFDDGDVEALLWEKRALDESRPPSWATVICFAIIVNLFPVLVIVWLIYKAFF